MSVFHTSDFRKGIKVEIEGEPYIMTECNFVKPGKGNAMYKCKMRNLIRGTMLDRTYKGGDTLEAADVEEIRAWVDQQPAYLQAAYTQVIQQGTAEEVADLVGRYRKETGKGGAGAPTEPVTPSGAEAELSEPVKQAAASLAPVGSKRSVVSQPDDPSNFDDAWKRFADMT